MIKPYVIDIVIDTKYSETDTKPFGSNPQDRWCVYASVDLGDRNILEYINTPRKPWRKYPNLTGGRYNKNGSLGYLFGLTVCSPAYKTSPRSEDVDEINKAIVQESFDTEAMKLEINKRLSKIGEVDVNDLSKHISYYLDTNELDV